MLLKVKTLKQQEFTVEATPDMTVEDLRAVIISTQQPKPGFTYKILTKGKILESEKKLHEYDIVEESESFVVILESKITTPPKPVEPVPKVVPQVTPVVTNNVPIPNIEPVISDADIPPSISIGENLFDMAALHAQNTQNLDMQQLIASMQAQSPQDIMQQLLTLPGFSELVASNPQMMGELLDNPDLLNAFMSQLIGGMGLNDLYEDPGIGSNVDVVSTSEPLVDGPLIKDMGDGRFEIHMTPEQKVDIDELIELGIDIGVAIEYYKAYGNNKEAAANAIMDELFQG